MNRDAPELRCMAELLGALDALRRSYPWFALEGTILVQNPGEENADGTAMVFYSANQPGHLVKDL